MLLRFFWFYNNLIFTCFILNHRLKHLFFPNHILPAYFLEAIISTLQQVGQHLFDGFIGTGVFLNSDFAHLGLAEGHIQLIIDKQLLQGRIQRARLHRKRNQRIERLSLTHVRKGKGQDQQKQNGKHTTRAFSIFLGSKGYIRNKKSHLQ